MPATVMPCECPCVENPNPCGCCPCIEDTEIYASISINASASGTVDGVFKSMTFESTLTAFISIPNKTSDGGIGECTICPAQNFSGDTDTEGYLTIGSIRLGETTPVYIPECPESNELVTISDCTADCGTLLCNQDYVISSGSGPIQENDLQFGECQWLAVDNETGQTNNGYNDIEEYCEVVVPGCCDDDVLQAAFSVCPEPESPPKYSISLGYVNSIGIDGVNFNISTTPTTYPLSGGLYVNTATSPVPMYLSYGFPPWATSKSASGTLNIGVTYTSVSC